MAGQKRSKAKRSAAEKSSRETKDLELRDSDFPLLEQHGMRLVDTEADGKSNDNYELWT